MLLLAAAATESHATDWITALTALIGVPLALVTLGLGLRQRKEEQRWKRVEFVAAKIKEFFDQRPVQTAMWLLDYSRLWLMPDGTRPSAGIKAGEGLLIADPVMISSLCDHRTFADDTESFGPDEMVCREAFDAWLTGLETIEQHVQTGLIAVDDLRPYLEYWIDKMASPDSEWKDPEFYVALAKFIEAYGYSGVQRLCVYFGYDVRPGAMEAYCRSMVRTTARAVPAERA